MNYYLVWSKQTGKLVARGDAKECAKALGYAHAKSFRNVEQAVKHGTNMRYQIRALLASDSKACPCWTCDELPDDITYQPGIVSQSCGKPNCARHEQWIQKYLKGLKEKFPSEK